MLTCCLTDPDSTRTLGTWDIWRGHSLGTCAFPGSTIIQCNVAHVFLNYFMEVKDNIPQIIKEKAAAIRWRLWSPWVYFPEGLENCLSSQLKIRIWGYGELLGLFLAYSLVGSKGSAGSHGRTGLCAEVLPAPRPPTATCQGFTPVNKSLFFPMLIVRSCIKAPCAWATVCSITLLLKYYFSILF